MKKKCLGVLILVLIVLVVGSGVHLSFKNKKELIDEAYLYNKNGTNKSVFASNGKESYLCCSDNDTFYMYYVDKHEFRKLDYKCWPNERIIRMAVDDSGLCSLLVYSSNNEIVDNQLLSTITNDMARIDVIDSRGMLIKQYNGSFFLSSYNIPNSFMTHDSVVYTMDCNGELTIANMSYGKVETFDIDGIVTSADICDEMLVVVYYINGDSYLKMLSNNGIEIYTTKLPKSNCKYGMCQLVDETIYFFNKKEGLFEFDTVNNSMYFLEKNVGSLSGVGFGEDGICVLREKEDMYEVHYLKYSI